MGGIRTLCARYHIEPDRRIGWTSANWDRFARENGAPELADGRVVGRSLWDFVEGDETRALYERLFGRVEHAREEVTLPFRCDSPETRRFMELRITPPQDERVEVFAELVREESRPYVALLDPKRPRAGDPVRICSFCKLVESPTRGWLEVEEATEELELDADPTVPPLDHSVCPTCRRLAEG